MGTLFPPAMPAKSALEPVFITTRNRWRVDVPATLSDNGKRLRVSFKKRQAARDFIGKITGEEPTAVIDPRLAMEASDARELIAPLDLDLIQVAREYVAAMKILEGSGGKLIDAVKLFRQQWHDRTSSQAFGEAVRLYLDSRADLRDSTLKSYSYTLESVFKPLHKSSLADIDTGDFEDILAGKGGTAARMHKANLSGFWRWASKPPRSWAKVEVIEALETPRTSKDNDITILRLDAVQALLSAAEAESHSAACAYAIAVFGGVRMAELERLTWAEVLPDHIEIGRDIAKKHSRRLVPICPTLRAWLKAHRDGAEKSDSIVPANWTEVSKNVRRRAGWAVEARGLKDPPKPTRGTWPANAPRHTCASVQIATGATLEDLVFKFGHAGGHEVLRAHYVARLTKKDAFAILAVGPNGTKITLKKSAK